uniref:Uncharacterized protein n=2 Tax=Aegilops tauschii subsp. strangulata TaxID=200361 RepID=A0A453JN20_AEGTS
MGSRLDARTLKDEVASMDRRPLLDLGHPLLNRVADSFIRAAGVGAARAVSREAYFVAVEGMGGDSTGLDSTAKRSHFSSARGDTSFLDSSSFLSVFVEPELMKSTLHRG